MTIHDQRRALASRMTWRAAFWGGRVEYLDETGFWLHDWPHPGSPLASGTATVYLGRTHAAAGPRLTSYILDARRNDPTTRASRKQRLADFMLILAQVVLPAAGAVVHTVLGREER